MKKILITGINGFLGSNLAKILSNFYEIIGLEYEKSNLHRLEGRNWNVYSSHENEIEKIFKENHIHAIIHAATLYRRGDEPIENLINSNIVTPIQLFELAKKNRVSAFLNTDSFFNDSNSNYGYLAEYTMSKRHCMEWLKKLYDRSTLLINMKIFHMYGQGDNPNKFIPQIINKISEGTEYLDLTPGEQRRDFIYINDVVNAYKTVLDKLEEITEFQEFQIGTGNSVSIKECVQLIKELASSKTELRFGALEYREAEFMNSYANIAQLKKLGWEVEYSLREGLLNVIRG